MGGWRGLAWFWGAVLAGFATMVVVLAVLGPPRSARLARAAPGIVPARPQPAPGPVVGSAGGLVLPVPASGPGPADTVAPPDPGLLEPAPDYPEASLPIVGNDGRLPRRVYARQGPNAAGLPRVAVIVAGIGLDEQASRAAAKLPADIDLALSAYADLSDGVREALAGSGHELLQSLPMEPEGYPGNDEGPRALSTGATAAENARSLEWVLSRSEGYAGVTGASDGQRGERFAASPGLMAAMEAELKRRGLFYIDPRPQSDAPDGVLGRGVDLVIDDPADGDDIDSKLTELEQVARQRGAAIGLIGRPTQTALTRLTAWSARLAQHGLVLCPVSTLLE